MTLENNFNLKLREKFLEILVRESKVSSNSTSDQLLFGQVEEWFPEDLLGWATVLLLYWVSVKWPQFK